MFVTSDILREAAQRLDDAMRRTEEGTFQPNRENDELTYALGNAEHTGWTRGVGVVPWKYGFSGRNLPKLMQKQGSSGREDL